FFELVLGQPGRLSLPGSAPRSGGSHYKEPRRGGVLDCSASTRWSFAAHLFHDFGSKVLLLLLDALADLVAQDCRDFAAGLLQVLLDGLLVVLYEGLTEQRDLAQPLANLAFRDLVDDLLRLARSLRIALRLFQEERPLFGNGLLGHFRGRHVPWIDGGDVHRDVLGNRLVARFHRDERADAGSVEVDADDRRSL